MFKKNRLTKRILSLLLAAGMVFSNLSAAGPVVFAAENSKTLTVTPETASGEAKPTQDAEPAELPVYTEDSELGSGFAGTEENQQEEERISDIFEEDLPDSEETVDFMVILEKAPLLSKFDSEEILAGGSEVAAYEKDLEQSIVALEKALKKAFGGEEGFRIGFRYTISTTGISVKTKYGNKEAIEAMDGVEKVYISPSFEIAAKDVIGYTNNASKMIGAMQLNETGYTGKGMKIAILDTGIVVDHPSFQALSEDQLTEDSLTKEEVKEVWDSLNAGRTTLRNAAYHSSKIPFIFNYNAFDFNVSHYTAQHDHGTHVAGIAAANAMDSTDVVGVAPEAQLVVMQVFNQSGGAEWSTILAALEDCVKLDVDTVNLSLGAPAGFADGDLEMAAVLSKFEKTDIQVVIAGGNDTNNAYMNLTGTDLSKTKDPDNGLVGTPATSSAALAVASADNDGADLLYFTVGGRQIGFSDSAVNEATNFFSNHKNAQLEFVHIDGVGRSEDYDGVDATGKVVVVSRGEISFQEKQATAKEEGALAVVVYNNVPGSFSMAISDGTGFIPCVSISRSDGLYLKEKASGSLKVCNGDLMHAVTDRAMSDFSSWGSTPDLKLKPEITGVGGNIYSTRDAGLSGSNYGNMSGTSMASPQVAGAITVLTQFLKENYSDAYTSDMELRLLAANVLMSTADPLIEGTHEYSPRKQGAGLVNLTKATTAGAYLTNPDTKEQRPKAEVGESAEGVYEFKFEIHNMDNAVKTYVFDSSIMSPDAKDGYMRNETKLLDAKVEVFANGAEVAQINVPANGKVSLTAKIALTESDKNFIEAAFENGTYVEGFFYAVEKAENGAKLVMPILGFYGDWSDAPVFDEHGEDASLHSPKIYTLLSRLGENPYIKGGKGGDVFNALSYTNPLDEMSFGMMRNSKKVAIEVKDKDTGNRYFYYEESNIPKTYYSASYGMIVPYIVYNYNEEVLIWDGKNYGADLPDGTKAVYSIHSYLDDGDDVIDDTYSFEVTLDNTKPVVKDADQLSAAILKDKDNGTVQLPMTITDNHHIAAVIFESLDGKTLGKYAVDNEPGVEKECVFDISGYGTDFRVIVADYACNETEIELSLDLSDLPNGMANPKKLDPDRIYGNETSSDANVARGWFSATREKFEDLKNETFDTEGMTYAAEFVNGYIIAQNTSDNNLVILTPYNTYWKSRTIWEQEAEILQDGFIIFYDMALDYEEDKLYAIGWRYGGDDDGDGKDNGSNQLFEIVLSENGAVSVESKGNIKGLPSGKEALTLGCTTEGQLYTISGEGKLYKLDNAGNTEYVATTSFVNEPNYSGVNVIQSMGYDHNTDKMYWFAHSQTEQGYSYLHVGGTYEVDLETGESTKIGGNGLSGYTSLFVPTELTSGIFTPNVTPTGLTVTPSKLTLAAGQTKQMQVQWQPWNAVSGEVTWKSEDESIATVNQNGVVKAVKTGKTQIVATGQIEKDGKTENVTFSAEIEVLEGTDALYGFVITDYNNANNSSSWITYKDSNLKNVKNIGSDGTLWQGGTYYNGYLYHVAYKTWEEEQVIYQGTELYRSKVVPGATPEETRLTETTLVGVTTDIEVGNLAFDYNTGRMYGVDYTNGGLCIIDIDSGAVDLLGTFTGDLGPAIMTAMCVTANGNIIGADMYGNLYLVDPDTLHCTTIGSIEPDSWFYAAMTYDYNSGNIYWNPCMDQGNSDLYLVRIDDDNVSAATTEILKVGGVSGDLGMEQTIMFTIPKNEPETTYIQVEDIEISNGEEILGLTGGTLQLKTQTTPTRPSVSAKQWKSSNPEVASVDHFGNLTFHRVGTTEITVTITSKGSEPNTCTDTATVNVIEAAGEFTAFLAHDEFGTHYFDFWMTMKDYAPQRSELKGSMIGTYTLRTGEYYDGYFYAYNGEGTFYRIDRKNMEDYVTLGHHGLDANDQVTSMTFDYTTGNMYALTLPIGNNPGYLAKVDLSNGKVSKLQKLDQCITAFAVDENGTLYGAGQSGPFETASLYTIDKETGACMLVTELPGAKVYTGENYYGTVKYNSQMTYDYGTKRLYLNATRHLTGFDGLNTGFYLIQLEDQPEGRAVTMIENLGKPALELRGSSKNGQMYLGMLCSVPEDHEIQGDKVTGIVLDRNAARAEVGDQIQLSAKISPSTAVNKNVRWRSEDESIATVDTQGVITAVAAGSVKIFAYSEENEEISTACTVTVLEKQEGKKTIAYTISGNQEGLIAFDLSLPSTTARKIATVSGGRKVVGVDVISDNFIYYLVNESVFPELYRFDLTTKRSTSLGQLEVFIGDSSDIAYDPINKLIYVVSGFYVFQFEEHRLQPGQLNRYAGYLDTAHVSGMPLSNLYAVTCKDGLVYFIGSANGASLYSVDDELKNLTCHRKVAVNTTVRECEMAYDYNSEQFILTDAGHRLYAFSETGEDVSMIDMVGNGWDINGLGLNVSGNVAIPTPEPTAEPTIEPTVEPTIEPTVEPTTEPTVEPTVEPTETEAPQPTETPEEQTSVTEIFTDVYDDWYKDYVQYVYDHGLMKGIDGTTEFRPDANITKAQVAQVLYNMEGKPEGEKRNVFTELGDVYETEWYADAVAWAYGTGVVTGDLNTKEFHPNADVTREQLALMMYRYAAYKEYDITAASDFEGLENAENVSNWAVDGMRWAVGAGLIGGIKKDEVKDLAPQGNATRAQVAAILQRFCENVK